MNANKGQKTEERTADGPAVAKAMAGKSQIYEDKFELIGQLARRQNGPLQQKADEQELIPTEEPNLSA